MKLFSAAILALSLLAGCSSDNKSQRDTEREQTRNNAAAKRKELEVVAGNYFGKLERANAAPQEVSLDLQIKEVPSDDGDVDPIMIPVLAGALQFNYLSKEGNEKVEKIGFPVEKAAYDVKSGKLNVVVTNSKYGQIIIEMNRKDKELTGSWNAPSSSASGAISVSKEQDIDRSDKAPLSADYSGYFLWENNKEHQLVDLKLNGTLVPPDSVQFDMTARLYFGAKNTPEYITLPISNVEFNPITGQFSATAEGSEISLSATLDSTGIGGVWSSKSAGRMGKVKLETSASEIPDGYNRIESLHGAYKGSLKNIHKDSNLPSRVMTTFVSSAGSISGNIRFYLGPFDSQEYFEVPFEKVDYDFYSKILSAKTSGQYRLTVTGEYSSKNVNATIYQDGLGAVAEIKVSR